MYIYELTNWPHFTWDTAQIAAPLAEVRYNQGRFLGSIEALGFKLQDEATLNTLTLDIIKSHEIEGEIINHEQVRSSLARRLKIDIDTHLPIDRYVEGVVEMTWDATQNYMTPLSPERLYTWHAALFPTGYSGLVKIQTGTWRDDIQGPMRVVSGHYGKERIHYQAPPAVLVPQEMTLFLNWFNAENSLDHIIKAGIAHLWFLTIHPFDDGNGRIGRAISDMVLARSEKHRFYSLSSQIQLERQEYYKHLENTQKGDLDITSWLYWFIGCLNRAIIGAEGTLENVLQKARFWQNHATTELNEHQRKMINKLLEGFEGKLTSSKWAKICKCSQDTANREINDLISKGILTRSEAGGRSTSYFLTPHTH